VDRGSRGGQNGYRRDYGQRSGYDGYGDNGYDDYEQEKSRTNGRRGNEENIHVSSGRVAGGKQSQLHANDQHNGGDMWPQAMIESLEKKIAAAHSDMSQALNNVTGKENEKFDLIFGILIELQRRQATLEESVRSLKSQLAPVGGMAQPMQQVPQGQTQPGQAQGQTATGGNMMPNGGVQNFMPQGNQNGNQGQMNNQSNGQMFMPNQMNMGQQYGNMVQADGSQAFFGNMPANVVLVAAPTNMQPVNGGMQQMGQGMQQMPYTMPQMMQGPMQPQMMMMQPQDQSGGNFQWNGADQSQQVSQEPAKDTGAVAQQSAEEAAPTESSNSVEEQAPPAPDSQKAAGGEERQAYVPPEEE